MSFVVAWPFRANRIRTSLSHPLLKQKKFVIISCTGSIPAPKGRQTAADLALVSASNQQVAEVVHPCTRSPVQCIALLPDPMVDEVGAAVGVQWQVGAEPPLPLAEEAKHDSPIQSL